MITKTAAFPTLMANWFYYDSTGQKQGPITGSQIKRLAEQGALTPEMIVENEEGESVPAQNVNGLTFVETAQPEQNPFRTAEPNPFDVSPFDIATANAVGVSEPIMKGYRDPGWISFFMILFTVLLLIMNVVAIPGNIIERDVLLKMQAGAYETEEEMTTAAHTSDTIQAMIGLTSLLLACIISITFFTWTYRIVKNAHCITYRPLRYGPGWAVGYYFIPILNLFRPFQALSDAHRVSKNPSDWVAAPGSSLLGWWWAMFLLSKIAGQILGQLTKAAMRVTAEGLRIDALLLTNACDTVLNLTVLPCLNLLTLWVVWKLCSSQQEAHQQVVFSPPPPMASDMYVQQPPENEWIVPSHTSGWAIAAGYAGMFAVLVFPAPIALILGIVALRDCRKRSLPGKGRAIFAIVMGSSLFASPFYNRHIPCHRVEPSRGMGA